MRRLIASVLLLALACPGGRAADVTFLRVWPQWHDAVSFDSYHEYRTREELTGNWTVLRSQPASRDGLYFLARVQNAGTALQGAAFTLRVIKPDSTETHVYSFPAGVPAGGRLFEIGLTGADWAGGKHVFPIAWELELSSADGRVLAHQSSFLWEKPAR